MTKVMDGVRVLEVAQHTFVPSAGAILADWGADVIKIEHPVRGKPLAADDPKMRAMEAYILAQRKGKVLEYGKH